jgi:hypothetical protein
MIATELVSLWLPLVPKTKAQFGACELRSVGSDVLAWRLPHLMERESAVLAREFKVAEQTYGADHLDLVLATGYISKLLRNGRVVGYLAKHYQELLFEFQKMTDAEVKAFHDDKRDSRIRCYEMLMSASSTTEIRRAESQIQ